jgi:putative tryptophan/tyrosine transport system substrate-binding protein
MKRRTFIAGLGGTAAWPVVARAYQPVAPVIGWLTSTIAGLDSSGQNAAFRRGLSEVGFVEGRNVTIEYYSADLHLERLPALAEDAVRRGVGMIFATPATGAVAASAVTKSIPIVSIFGADPVELGLAASLSRPGGNITGISLLMKETAAKRLSLLHELAPAATLIGYLSDPSTPAIAELETKELQTAAGALGISLLVVNAKSESAFEAAFATLARDRAGALLVGTYTLFFNNYAQLTALAARHHIPAIYQSREALGFGGLMSYGTDLPDAYRRAGIYAGRILKGQSPAELPVQQSTKVLLSLNLKVAKALGITFPTALLVRADEVIE